MSPAAEPAVADRDFTRTAIPLLSEYTDKLSDLMREVLDHAPRGGVFRDEAQRAVWEDNQQRVRRLLPPARELARQASAVLEQGHVKDLQRVELWLRLAEFEAVLEAAGRVGPPTNTKK